MRKPLFLLLFILLNATNSFSQSSPRSIRHIARSDGSSFKLSQADSVRFRQERENFRSDLLKPSKANTSDTLLLSDSIYVNAYRKAAYANNMRKTSGKGVLIVAAVGVAVLVGIYLIIKSTADGLVESLSASSI